MNLLVLILQLIMMGKNFCIRVTSTRHDNPNKFTDLDNSIWSKLMYLNLKLAKNIQKHRMLMYVKASNEKILEHNRLILFSDRRGIFARRSSKSFRKKRKELSRSEIRPLVTIDHPNQN
jgi:uncharacterized protein YigA (DUF484 family)